MSPPRLSARTTPVGRSDADLIAVAVLPGEGPSGDHPAPSPGARLGPSAVVVASQTGADLEAAVAHTSARPDGFAAAAGDILDVPLPGQPGRSVLLVGVGDQSPGAWRRTGAAVARRAVGRAWLATDLPARTDAAGARAFVEGLGLAAYRFSRRSRPDSTRDPVQRVDLHLGAGAPAWLAPARATVSAVHRARDLINAPALEQTPDALARQAVRWAQRSGLQASVRDDAELRQEGFGGLVAVGSGSCRPPRFVELRHQPVRSGRGAGGDGPHIVLVGKGITFDSGGLSLKPPEAMASMKTDMAGAGVVLAVMTALRDLDVPWRVTGLLALAENLPSGTAMRPGDVLRTYDGTTVEVLNTDAEGRLVLADALGYAATRLAPDVIIDVATLTGAASVGLGRRHGALYSTDPLLCRHLVDAAATAGEQVWPMPLVEEYQEVLASPVADLAHVPRDPTVKGGSITAALFLRAFTHDVPWAHLDMAGPARADADEHEVTRGGTGYAVRLLLRWLEQAVPTGR